MAERLRKIGLSDPAINFLAKFFNDGKKFRAAVRELAPGVSKDEAFGQLASGMGVENRMPKTLPKSCW